MASKITSDDEPIADINIVPFVDIILVVLIIFMVTTPIIMKPSIAVNLPNAASGEDTAPSQFLITIDSKAKMFLNGNPTTVAEIGKEAKKLADKNPSQQAIISADKDVSHGDVVSVIDAVKSNGIKKFAITIEKN